MRGAARCCRPTSSYAMSCGGSELRAMDGTDAVLIGALGIVELRSPSASNAVQSLAARPVARRRPISIWVALNMARPCTDVTH